MTAPRVVSETRMHVPEVMPPSSTAPHEWLSEEAALRYDHALSSGRPFDVYLTSAAEHRIRNQALDAAPMRLEVMGLLLGEVRSWKGQLYSVVRDAVTTDLVNTPASVKFAPSALPKLFTDMDSVNFDYVVVGWYHSHPGHTCFMSKVDLGTQRAMFSQPYHCAIVIDPVNKEMEAFKARGDGYIGIPFAVVKVKALRVRKLRYETATDHASPNVSP